MAPAMTEAASPIGIANVSSFFLTILSTHQLLIQDPYSSQIKGTHNRLLQAGCRIYCLQTQNCCQTGSGIYYYGKKSLICIKCEPGMLICCRSQANQVWEKQPSSTPSSPLPSRTMRTIDGAMQSKWTRLLK